MKQEPAQVDLGGLRPPDGTITDLEAAKLLLDAWKFRQAHAWSFLTRYFSAATLVSVIPYVLKDELAKRIKFMLLALPVLGGLIALAATWLYAAEYIRSQAMNHQFRELLKNYGYYARVDLRRFERIFLSSKIGWTTIYVLTVASILLACINVMIIWSLVKIL